MFLWGGAILKVIMTQQISITVAYATPERQVELPVQLDAHCNISLAIKKSGILQQIPEIPFPDIEVGVWGKRLPLDGLIRDGDRVEIYRSLIIDPKEARRQRIRT